MPRFNSMAITYVPQVTTIVEAPGLLQIKPVTFPQGQLQLDKKTISLQPSKASGLGNSHHPAKPSD